MCRFHIWNQFLHISLSDGEKNCPRSAKIRACFWNLSRDCDNLRFFWKQIRNLRKKLHLYRDFWRDDVFLVWDMLKSLILVKILFLLFTNSRIGSGPNRPRIRIRHGRKYPPLFGILFFFLIFEMHYVRHSLCVGFRQQTSQHSVGQQWRLCRMVWELACCSTSVFDHYRARERSFWAVWRYNFTFYIFVTFLSESLIFSLIFVTSKGSYAHEKFTTYQGRC